MKTNITIFLAAYCMCVFRATTALSNSPASKKSKPVSIPSLGASQFRHPLDKQLTSMVQRLPLYDLAELGLRNTFPLVEQTVRLDLLSSCVKVSKEQLSHVYDLLLEACDILNLPKASIPELYVQSSPQANAYTLALQPKGNNSPSVIVITSALVDRCTLPELQAIIGHELGHLKCEHSLYLTLGGLASTPLRQLPFIGSQVDTALQEWRLAAEYTCDRASLLVAQDVQVVASALLKLFAGTSRYELDPKAFVQQAMEYEKQLETANPLVKLSIEQQRRTHPLPVKRVAELEKWAKSTEYRNLVEVR
ncbi:peptidase M48 family protein [Nitzschia inconspicua]|uniref:Peptidase M48 family protein n=1 Tax=Nitzschia inconspicua TaxID=303405 RepID=A0A9K3KRC6_9STRA|nr:peptidase M48 family protein [Nitzschia inconspicua]